MGDIARSAQVARATVYNNFDDKQDILAEIIRDYMKGYAEIPQKLRERARSGQTSFELVQEMVREALEWRVQNADLRPIIDVARNLRGSGWEHAADDAAGHIRPDVNLEFGVRATYAMIEAILSTFPVSSDEGEIKRVAHQLALLHWYSICSIAPEDAPQSPLGRKSPATT
jgi:AcrR family transcriptional regulator